MQLRGDVAPLRVAHIKSGTWVGVLTYVSVLIDSGSGCTRFYLLPEYIISGTKTAAFSQDYRREQTKNSKPNFYNLKLLGKVG